MVAHNDDGQQYDAVKMRSSVITLTPQQASEWLQTMKYKHQRSINRDHAEMLAGEMRRGRFVQGTTLRIVYINDERHLIDGQHRLSAVALSGKAQVFTLVEEWAPNEEYVAWAYGSLDIGRRRAPGDLYSALELPDRLGLTKTHINALAPAMEVMASGMLMNRRAGRINRDQRLAMMELYAPYMRRFVEETSGCDRVVRGATERSYVVAVAMLSLRFSEPYATSRGAPDVMNFWRGAVFDDKVAADDPRKLVNRHFLTTTMTNPHNAVGVRTMTTAPYGARYLASCFNAYMARKARKQAKVYDATAPFGMYGVPSDCDLWIK